MGGPIRNELALVVENGKGFAFVGAAKEPKKERMIGSIKIIHLLLND